MQRKTFDSLVSSAGLLLVALLLVAGGLLVWATQVATVFKGETLRGLLLNAYAFGTISTIAGIAAVVAFVGAGLLFLLCLLGILHARKTPSTEELLHTESTVPRELEPVGV